MLSYDKRLERMCRVVCSRMQKASSHSPKTRAQQPWPLPRCPHRWEWRVPQRGTKLFTILRCVHGRLLYDYVRRRKRKEQKSKIGEERWEEEFRKALRKSRWIMTGPTPLLILARHSMLVFHVHVFITRKKEKIKCVCAAIYCVLCCVCGVCCMWVREVTCYRFARRR